MVEGRLRFSKRTDKCEYGNVSQAMIDSGCYPTYIKDIVDSCSFWEPKNRKTAKELLNSWRRTNAEKHVPCDKQEDLGKPCEPGHKKPPYRCSSRKGMWAGVCEIVRSEIADVAVANLSQQKRADEVRAGSNGGIRATPSRTSASRPPSPLSSPRPSALPPPPPSPRSPLSRSSKSYSDIANKIAKNA